MLSGTIKWFSRKKGFGIIEHDDGEDVFLQHMHHSNMIENKTFPESIQNRRVIFETEPGIRGLRAINAQLLP